jgi:hypothetical protein
MFHCLQLTGGECQVVNLGAGSDTWFWNLVDEGRAPRKAWVEVDFAECTARKIQSIRSRKQLLEKIKSKGNLKLAPRLLFEILDPGVYTNSVHEKLMLQDQ